MFVQQNFLEVFGSKPMKKGLFAYQPKEPPSSESSKEVVSAACPKSPNPEGWLQKGLLGPFPPNIENFRPP